MFDFNGDQRFIFIQTTANNKRKKRIGKKKNKCTLPQRERVIHVLVTGKIKDYTHPKEVDPFWDKIYRQYEHLVYSEMYYRTILKQYCVDDISLSSGALDVITRTLQAIEKQKAMLVAYMVNFMFIMYGSVMKSRFYGWMRYSQKFTSKFNEVTMQLISKLKFDANKTRCSVYYYQAFWLCGLSVIGEIRKQLTTTCNLEVDMDRGTLTIPVNSKSEVRKKVKKSVDSEHETSLQSIIYPEADYEDPKNLDSYKSIELDKEKSPETLLIETSDEEERQNRIRTIINNILKQLDLSQDTLYRSTERSLLKIGRFIKQKIKKGSLDIPEKDLLFLKQQYLNSRL